MHTALTIWLQKGYTSEEGEEEEEEEETDPNLALAMGFSGFGSTKV